MEGFAIYDKIFNLKITDKNLERYCKTYFQKIDTDNPTEKILGLSYYYARKKCRLRDYQAKSFASELTAILTNEIIDTDVSLIYREEWLDSYLLKKFDQCTSTSSFIDYMVKFYKSSKSWKYERVGKHFKVRITGKEMEMFESLPARKNIDKFNWLLLNYDYDIKVHDYNRVGLPPHESFGINLCTSQYENLMSVSGKTKTQKFLNLLYYGYSLNEF